MELKITMEDFDGTVRVAYYSNFQIDDEVNSLKTWVVFSNVK